MTQSIPNGFSMDQLQNMLENAQSEPTPEPKGMGEATQDQIMELADRVLTDALQEINDPLVHKAIMCAIINNFIRWHNSMADHAIESNQERETVACWSRDAGKFQAISNILFTINCGEGDWMMNQ
nr:hypothetical protein 6 [Pelagibacteraceae bacterium]